MKTTTLPSTTNMNSLSNQKRAKILIGWLFILFPFFIFGQTWTGNVSDDWHTGGNWTGSAVPGVTSTTVTIPSTVTSGRWPKLSANATVGILTMNAGSQLDVNGNTLISQYGTNITTATINDASGGSGLLQSGTQAYNANFSIQNSVFHAKAQIQAGGTSTANNTSIGSCTFNKSLTVVSYGAAFFFLGSNAGSINLSNTFPNVYNADVIVHYGATSSATEMLVEFGNTGKGAVFNGNLTVYMNTNAPYYGPGSVGGSHSIAGNYTLFKQSGSGTVHLGANSITSSATLNITGDLIYEVLPAATSNTTLLGVNNANANVGNVNVGRKVDMRLLSNTAGSSNVFLRNLNNSTYTGQKGDIIVIPQPNATIGRVDLINCKLELDSLHFAGAQFSNILDNTLNTNWVFIPHASTGSRTYIDGNRITGDVLLRQNVATSANDFYVSGSRSGTNTGAKGNAYLGNVAIELGGTNNGQMQIGRFGTDSIYGNLTVSSWGIGDLYLSPGAGRVYVGGNMTMTQTGTNQGWFWVSPDGNVEIKGDLSITAPNAIIDMNMNAGKKVIVGGKFNFDGNHTGSPTMTFVNFEVGTNGGIFKTGAKATGGTTSSVGPGKLIIRNSILRDSIYEIYDITNADILDNQFFGDSLYLDQTGGGTNTYIDGNKFNVRSSAFGMDVINSWTHFNSGERPSGTHLGNAYRGNVFVKTTPATSTVHFNSHWGKYAMDSIYGNFTADLKDQSQLWFAWNNATNSKVWIGGNVDVNVPGTTQTGEFNVTTGNVTVVGDLDVFWPRGQIDFTPTSPNKFTVGGKFSFDGGVLNDVVSYYFDGFEVATRGGLIKTGIKATGGTDGRNGPNFLSIRNSTLSFDRAEFYGINNFSFLDSKFYGDSLFTEVHIDGLHSYLDGNLFDVRAVQLSSNRSNNNAWLWMDSGARIHNSSSGAKGNTYKGNLSVRSLGDFNISTGGSGVLSFRLGSGATDSIYGNVDVYMEKFSQFLFSHASTSLSKVWIGGNFSYLNKIPETGSLWAEYGAVTINGNMDIKAPSWVDIDFAPDIVNGVPNKFIVKGTFSFDGNVNNNHPMDFQYFEVGTAGGVFKTGSAATGGVASSVGPGKISIKNSILRNTQYDWYGVDHADLFDNQFFGDSLFMDQTTGNWTLIDGNTFNIRSTAFTSNLLNTWIPYQSGSRIANNISGAKGNAYRGNLRFAQLNNAANNYIQAYVGYGAMDSIYGTLCTDFRDYGYLYLAHNNANLSKVWVGGDMKLTSPTTGIVGYLYATTGQVNVVGNMDVNWRRVDVDITPISPNKFQVGGFFNFDGNDLGDPPMEFQFFEVGTKGGSFLTGAASKNGTSTSIGPANLNIRNSIFKNDTIKTFGVNEFSLFDNTFEGSLAHF